MVVNPKVEAMDGEGGTGLPASIEMAWGLRERPAKGPKPGLSLQRIVDAAVRIATSDGLSAVSMSRVAAELDASTMALYRYVGAKDELLALMMDAASGLPPADTVAEGWRAGLSQWATDVLAMWRRHPWALRIQSSTPPATPNQLLWLERGLGMLGGTGLAESEKLSVMMMLAAFVRSQAAMAADMQEATQAAGSTPEEAMGSYGRLLTRLIDADRFPALSAAIAAGVLDQTNDDPDAEFLFGLERLLDGIDTLVRSRTGAP
jgi:AcrR family transcriptional regulator